MARFRPHAENSSISALAAAFAAPIFAFWFFGNGPVAWAFALIALLLLWRHKANIEKLLAGRETTIGR